MSLHQVIEPASPVAIGGETARRRLADALRSVLKIPQALRERRERRRLFDARAELGYELLAGRVALTKLKGAAAEPYLQGLDVIEVRGQRLLEVAAVRAQRSRSCPWRLSPALRAERKQPNTPAGRRQTDWLLQLEAAGMLRAWE